MGIENAELVQAHDATHRASFFRHSGWMMATSVGGGVLMSLVHIFSKFIPSAEYAVFGTLLQFLNWIALPAVGLQATFAHHASSVVTPPDRRQLVGAAHAVLRGTFCIWLLILTVCFLFRTHLLNSFKISNPAALWITLLIGLVMLWQPIVLGLLQGRQNFLWLGWAIVFNSAGRVILAGVMIFAFSGWAAGMMTGALIGATAALLVGFWHNRDLLSEPREPFQWREWLGRVVPLSLASGTSMFLFSADLIAVQTHLAGTAPYVFGGTLARGIVLFTAPLVSVMFPKIAHSVARRRDSDLMLLTFILTLALAAFGALCLTFMSGLLIKLGSKAEYLSIVPLMPLFAWSMVPLAAANVLVNNLLARADYRCVPVLISVAVGYWIALQFFHDSFRTVVTTLGVFNTLFLMACAFFTWGVRKKEHEGVSPSRI